MTDQDIDRGFVRIAEGQVHYHEHGRRSDAPPLFLLHASPSSSKSLIPLMRELGKTRYVIAPDTLGNGESPPPLTADPDMAVFAKAMDAVAVALDFDQVDVYGTHTGSHTAIEWGIAAPARVRRIILDGVAVLDDEQRKEFLENYAPPRQPDPTGAQFHWAWNFMRDQMIFFPYYKKDKDHLRVGGTFDAEILHTLTMDVLRGLKTYHMPYRAVFQHDLETRLPQVSQPTLCVVTGKGELDPGADFVLERIQNIKKGEVDADGGPAALATAIEAFLAAA